MRSTMTLATLAAFMLGAPHAEATPTDNTATGFVGNVRVFEVDVGNTTTSNVIFIDASGNLVTCGNSFFFSFSRSHPSHDLIHRTLMSTMLSGGTMNLDYELISNTCWVKIIRVRK